VKIHAWSVPVFLAGLAMSATNACAAPTITYFDVPGGSIGSANHGYRRSAGGTITTFDAPGADFTVPQDISKGVITGQYVTVVSRKGAQGQSGFILPPDGPAVVFSVNNSGFTEPVAINNGVIVGSYAATKKATYACCGFVRAELLPVLKTPRIGVFMEPEVGHGKTNVYEGVQG